MKDSTNPKKWLAGVCAAIVAPVIAGFILFYVLPRAKENHIPLPTADHFSVAEGEELRVPAPGVLDNDTDPDGDAMTVMLVSDVEKGQLVLNPDGSLSYRPQSDFSGTDGFSYRVRDGKSESEPAEVSIAVNARAENDFDPPRTVGSGTMENPWTEIEVTYRYMGDHGTDVYMTAHPLLSNGGEVPGYVAQPIPIAKGNHGRRFQMQLNSGHGTYLITQIRMTMQDSQGTSFYEEQFLLVHPWTWKR